MPTKNGAAVNKNKAVAQINEIARRLTGDDIAPFVAPSVHHNKKWLQEMRAYEALASWFGEIETKVSGTSDVNLDVPLEYLTTEGLRWLAGEKGLDIDDVTRKSDLIEIIRGD